MTGLSEQEREALTCDCEGSTREAAYCPLHADSPHLSPDLSADYLLRTVERIVAAREAALAERIAQEVGTHRKVTEATRDAMQLDPTKAMFDQQAWAFGVAERIAREIGRES